MSRINLNAHIFEFELTYTSPVDKGQAHVHVSV